MDVVQSVLLKTVPERYLCLPVAVVLQVGGVGGVLYQDGELVLVHRARPDRYTVCAVVHPAQQEPAPEELQVHTRVKNIPVVLHPAVHHLRLDARQRRALPARKPVACRGHIERPVRHAAPDVPVKEALQVRQCALHR